MNDDVFEKIRDLTDRRDKNQILKEACNEIRLTSKSAMQYAVSIVVGIVLGFFISNSNDTVIIMRDIVESASGILLAFIAMVFSSYSIFQALMSEQLISLLVNSEGNLLKQSNGTFLNLTILYTIGIVLNFIIAIILKIVPNDFLIVESIIVCNLLAWIGIVLYLSFHLLLFLEVINFSINLYRMFCVYNTLKALKMLDSKEDNE